MNQNKSFTGTSDKNRKKVFSKITKHNKKPKSYGSSQNRSLGIKSNMTENTFPYTTHHSQNNECTKIQNNTIGQHKQHSSTKYIKKNININHTTTTHYNTRDNLHDTIPTRFHHPTKPDNTKTCSNIMRQKNTKNETYNSNKISTSRKYTYLLLQHHINNKNNINFNMNTPNNTCNQIPTAQRKKKVSTNKNDIISNSQNHNNKKEYRMTNPRPIKDTNNEGTRVTNKNIKCNKEPIPKSNTHTDESNKNKNTEHNTITIGRDTKISRSY